MVAVACVLGFTRIGARFVDHVVGRFGPETVEQWHFEAWNEPNIPK